MKSVGYCRKVIVALLLLASPALAVPSGGHSDPNLSTAVVAAQDPGDPYLWLEQIDSAKSMEWVRRHNAQTLSVLTADPRFEGTKESVSKTLQGEDRVPEGTLMGGYVYNFWQDAQHQRGLWRRMALSRYATVHTLAGGSGWETVLDLDALAKAENENWVWKGESCLAPAYRRCLINLSRGGQDAVVVREFDTQKKLFVSGGFSLPEAKSSVAWRDKDTLFVGTDWGAGSLTQSGYPRVIKLWRRHTPLTQAVQLYLGNTGDVSVYGDRLYDAHHTIPIITRARTFYSGETFLLGNGGALAKIPMPDDAELSALFAGRLIYKLRSDWMSQGRRFVAGSVVALSATDFGAVPELIYAPTPKTSVEAIEASRDRLYLEILDNVSSRILAYDLGPNGWHEREVPLPKLGNATMIGADPFDSHILVDFQSFLVPPTVYEVGVDGHGTVTASAIHKQPSRFDEARFESEQYEATSRDGTKVPYFIVHAKGMAFNSHNPTLLYGYGGFEVSMLPYYLQTQGHEWLEKGGVYVLANIRGGGEFGPAWHEAAILGNRQRAYDDFIAVAEDLIKRQVTEPAHLGIMGGSNGGLLMGAVTMQRPELFKAVVCQVPLLDMLRYNKLLAGASWVGEYGDPADPKIRAALLKYSPYQNLRKDRTYPKIFFETSTKDDRVDPAHARKMAARMEAYGKPFYYYENIEGGHGAAANLSEKAMRMALEYTYLYEQLMAGADGNSSR